eukprot:403347214
MEQSQLTSAQLQAAFDAKLKLTKLENTTYCEIFNAYCKPHEFRKDKMIITPDNVKLVFNQSGLSSYILMQVYNMVTDGSKEYLEKNQFLKALKLIAIYQQYKGFDRVVELIGTSKVKLVNLQNPSEDEDEQQQSIYDGGQSFYEGNQSIMNDCSGYLDPNQSLNYNSTSQQQNQLPQLDPKLLDEKYIRNMQKPKISIERKISEDPYKQKQGQSKIGYDDYNNDQRNQHLQQQQPNNHSIMNLAGSIIEDHHPQYQEPQYFKTFEEDSKEAQQNQQKQRSLSGQQFNENINSNISDQNYKEQKLSFDMNQGNINMSGMPREDDYFSNLNKITRNDCVEDDLDIKITSQEQVASGYFGMGSYTQYKIESRSKLQNYDENKLYIAFRRFSDFQWLHSVFSENVLYKGLIIAPLPEKKLIGNMDAAFIEKRRSELENFLRMIAQHNILRYDQHLKAFLTLTTDEFPNYMSNPTKFEKVLGLYKGLPSIQNLSLSAITDAVQNQIVSVKNDFYELNEPKELHFENAQNAKKEEEITINLEILLKIRKLALKQKEKQKLQAQSLGKVGEILQKIYNLDNTTINLRGGEITNQLDNLNLQQQQEIYLDEDYQEEQKASPSRTQDYDHLNVIKSDSSIVKLFKDLSIVQHNLNPFVWSEAYLSENVMKLQAIKNSFADRKINIRQYVNKVELRGIKMQKMNSPQIAMDHTLRFDLNNEIQNMNKELSDLKRAILSMNSNIVKELDLMESTRVPQLRKLLQQQGTLLFDLYSQSSDSALCFESINKIEWIDLIKLMNEVQASTEQQ